MGRHRRRREDRTISPVEGNPSVIRSAVVAVLTLLAALGVTWAGDVDEATVSAVVTLLAVLAPLAAGLWVRFGVTPNAKVVSRVTTAGDVVAGDAAVAETGTPLPVHVGGNGTPVVLATSVRGELVSDLEDLAL